MNMQMPEMDGAEASQRICARWSRGERPHIVAITTNAMKYVRLGESMDDYISKPIKVIELLKALGKAKTLGILI